MTAMIGRVVFALMMIGASEGPGDPPRTTRQEFHKLVQDWYAAQEASRLKMQEPAATPEARKARWLAATAPLVHFHQDFIDLAIRNPQDPVGFDAPFWVLTHLPSSRTAHEAVDLLVATHIGDPRIQKLCHLPYVVESVLSAPETLFRALSEKGSSRESRAWGAFALGRHLEARARVVRHIRVDPDFAEHIRSRMDPAEYQTLNSKEPAALEQEAMAAFQSVVDTAPDVRGADRPTLGEEARDELFELERLAVGKLAPEIVGQDVEGRPMKLSFYRGKFVVLRFWSSGANPLFDFERTFVKKMEGKPFVLLGVNQGEDREAAARIVREQGIPWNSWWDGPAGPIAKSWKIRKWTTTYVIDPDGVIQLKQLGERDFDVAVEYLMKNWKYKSN